MGIKLNNSNFIKYIDELAQDYDLYGPVLKEKAGRYSDTDLITYEKVESFSQMYWDKKSDYSAKDVVLPMNQTIFYFTEDSYTKPELKMRPSLVFLRSCDLHGMKRTDQIYLDNKFADIYYQERRDLIKFVLIGCEKEFDNCHCVDFETNYSDNYSIAINFRDDGYEIDIKDESIKAPIGENIDFEIDYVKENKNKVNIPEVVELGEVIDASIWDEYSTRCIACGACNFVCPTCTCFTMQDIFYDENRNVGERKRVLASCEIDGFCDMAGGHTFREDKKDRMRFKVLHKVSDFKERFGYNMCVGCGRCDDVCPEHILFSKTVNNLYDYVNGGNNNE
ncbi:anaerobic sulfite reductase subunit A [Bacilli bacterium PM5-3]|nr:anaerobic sulfite reductase subunit A [Bacilli bacterium PM5-3]MDH6603969.1 anaerobic sulfite reductase subunit A [Bacilli bacterium PM5-9]